MDPQIVRSLVRVVELKDQTTVAHTWRVTLYAQALAEAAGWPREDVQRLMHAAVLHDIGKIDIPQEILGKPSKLTDEEQETIRRHTVLGYERLKRMGVTDEMVLELVRSHHERLDGSGYPDRLRGEEIPESARIFAVIDTFDAMTSLRPYRSGTGQVAAREAIAELVARKGTWYCPECVDRFVALFETGALDWILNHFNDEKSLGELPTPDELMRERP